MTNGKLLTPAPIKCQPPIESFNNCKTVDQHGISKCDNMINNDILHHWSCIVAINCHFCWCCCCFHAIICMFVRDCDNHYVMSSICAKKIVQAERKYIRFGIVKLNRLRTDSQIHSLSNSYELGNEAGFILFCRTWKTFQKFVEIICDIKWMKHLESITAN